MRALGRPSASTVASVIALASAARRAAPPRTMRQTAVTALPPRRNHQSLTDLSVVSRPILDILECRLVASPWLRRSRYRGSLRARLRHAAARERRHGCRCALARTACRRLQLFLPARIRCSRRARTRPSSSIPVRCARRCTANRSSAMPPETDLGDGARRGARAVDQGRQGHRACRGKTQRPARAARSRRSRPPTARTARPATISWRATCATAPNPGSMARLAAPAASGKSATMKPWQRT